MHTSPIPHDQRAVEVKPIGFTLWLANHIEESVWDAFTKEEQDNYLKQLVLDNQHRMAIHVTAKQIPRTISSKDAED